MNLYGKRPQDGLVTRRPGSEHVVLYIDPSAPGVEWISEREVPKVDETLLAEADHWIHASTIATASDDTFGEAPRPGSF
jgi:hypothetical protein